MRFSPAVLVIVVSLVFVNWSTATALCPSNGNTHVIYVTSNMGDNIWAFDTAGHYIGLVLNKSSFPFRVEKLRDMKFGPGNHLYVTSARGTYSRVFAVSGNGLLNRTLNEWCTRNYLFTVTTQSSKNPFLDHPYAVAFHPLDGSLFVSNQNSVTVTKYKRVDSEKGMFPRWEPVRNVAHALSNVSELDSVPANAGLFASSWSNEYSMLSVRGLALSPPLPRALIEQAAPAGYYSTVRGLAYYVVVCDIAADRLHVFLAQTGEHLFSIPVSSPVQVLFPSRYEKPIKTPTSYFEIPYVYVTSKEDGSAFLVPLVAPPRSADMTHLINPQERARTYRITKQVPHRSLSGIYENPSHEMLLIADRIGRRISTYASPFLINKKEAEPSPFLGHFTSQLPDQPEFILSTMVEQQSSIPFCYELSEDGSFRYVALCTAGYMWALGILFSFLVAVIFCVLRKVRRCQEWSSKYGKEAVQIPTNTTAEEAPLVDEKHVEGYGTAN
ncbi:putative mucin-associated surface protein (MASP) [Trypanosoma rangeli]|uniref:Putative mucin-associated surface protein (MASP) n=1 Tax=Trypanosoma rangeli TaxID=5698 RepID=A0A3R7NQT8_TRYRA|nr:putative mucin-associated surface protein (MASP) [Trypanosoma rangeli]RNF06297.1 putative mucin-associated surface protein (MASP) [Trypanosoma rangeli]|eukprot:RNF06297.1 putative mucin-associated surface protein (MASP) [Trypanosoma rangeli]